MGKLFTTLILLSISLSSLAQTKGTVADQLSGEPLQGATVRIKNKATGKTALSVATGLDGTFVIKALSKGNYELEVSFSGYKPYQQSISADQNPGALVIRMELKEALSEVRVTGRIDKGSDRSTMLYERRADNIINAVSARTIEVSPDLSVANVTQRIAGVSLQRSANGEGQYAIVRGMDKRYNYTLVNGIKIPSPDNKNRYVPLDIFPADLLDRLEVTKALTPNMEGDAIGGVVNMVMKDAPDHFSVRANAAIGQAQSFFDGTKFTTYNHSDLAEKSPRIAQGDNYLAAINDFSKKPFLFSAKKAPLASTLGLSVGGRVFRNKLGVLLAGSYQNLYRDVQSQFFRAETDRITNNPSFTNLQSRRYSFQQERTGMHARLDYVINPFNTIRLYAGSLSLRQNQYRFLSDTGLVLGRVGPGTGRIGNTFRTETQLQHITNISLQGEHKLSGSFRVNWSAVYSKATGNQPQRGTLVTSTGVTREANGTLTQQPVYIDNSTYQDWSRNSDEDKSGYLNLTYDSHIFNTAVQWTVGGMYRDKTRTSDYDKYNLRPDPSPQEYKGNAAANTFSVFNPQGTATDALNYDAYEKVGAGYAMFKFETGGLQALGGLRYENTHFNWVTASPKTVEGATGSIRYYDVLPSINLKYKLTAKQFLRLSYYSSLSRPGFYEITPHVYDDGVSDYPEQGNPHLKRTTAENFDIRWELFPKGVDQVLAGVFYKSIKNPIEYAIVNIGNLTYYSPANFGTANNYGFEADVTRYFHSLGVKANYTYTSSAITTSKVRRFQKTNTDGTKELTQENRTQTRPLQGQSKHVANLSLLYKNNKQGIDGQLAAVYTGARINTVSPFFDNDIWQKSFVQLDFSLEVRLTRSLSVYTKVNNILNTPYKLEIHIKNGQDAAAIPYQEVGKNAFIRKDTYGANYLFGLRFKR
ncbi:MAG: TonB-dependent receptor [Williamsia sp.]|nr:TonB-dependent receptor [Williamsia sp.]